jgi:ectoine hydroxylase-related dioxygenase (phytanoyl-CoA dioxygenase family)
MADRAKFRPDDVEPIDDPTTNPIPVDVDPSGPRERADRTAVAGAGQVRHEHFAAPFDWDAIDACVAQRGAAVVEGILDGGLVERVNGEIDAWLLRHAGAGTPASGSRVYDAFLGHRTIRLHGLANKLPSAPDVLAHELILGWARRMLRPVADGIVLNAGELIQIEPDEPAQFLHRDSDSWPAMPRGQNPLVVNCIVAFGEFTTANGATNLALGSHTWPVGRHPGSHEIVQPELRAGDALLFRGDIIHGGGANRTDRPRRGVSLSYCAGWLRPVENSFLNVPPERACSLPADVRALLGYVAHDASAHGGGLVGLFENGDPANALATLPGAST